MYYFSAWGRLGYKQPTLFFNFSTPISLKLIEVGTEISNATASKPRVATADQLTIAKC